MTSELAGKCQDSFKILCSGDFHLPSTYKVTSKSAKSLPFISNDFSYKPAYDDEEGKEEE